MFSFLATPFTLIIARIISIRSVPRFQSQCKSDKVAVVIGRLHAAGLVVAEHLRSVYSECVQQVSKGGGQVGGMAKQTEEQGTDQSTEGQEAAQSLKQQGSLIAEQICLRRE